MTDITFVSGNQQKVRQATEALKQFKINVINVDCEIDEIQAHNPSKIGIAKAKAAYNSLNKPLVINDHFWTIHALNGFPGGYMKDINQWFQPEDFLQLLAKKTDRSATLTETVVYYDGHTVKQFSVEFHGNFINEVCGTGHVSMERVFVYAGSKKTIAEHIDAGEHARNLADSAWNAFGKWYSKQ